MRPFSLLVKPAGADCNLSCPYCFYRDKASLHPSAHPRMSEDVLERTLAEYCALPMPEHSVAFQGGEPLLMGEDFFRRAAGLADGCASFSVQTNATLVTDSIASFFADAGWLVGVSPHGGTPEFRRGYGRLVAAGVEVCVLQLVTRNEVGEPERLYGYLRDELGCRRHQYIECVAPAPFAVTDEEWGGFMVRLFDEWLRRGDVGSVEVRAFDSLASQLLTGRPTLCQFSDDCRHHVVVEANGDIYPCDFFVGRGLCLGNIMTDGLEAAVSSPAYAAFGARKRGFADCPRSNHALDGGWRRFFAHAAPVLRKLFPAFVASALFACSVVAQADETPRATGYVPFRRGAVVRCTEKGGSPSLMTRGRGAGLPSRWDAREHGWVSPVKNQGGIGACWAFATYAVLETQLMRTGRGERDFSEKNMVNLHGWSLAPDEGGNYNVSAAYLLRWGGAVAETNDAYVTSLDRWTPSNPLMPETHVQNVVWLPSLDGTVEARDELKSAIMAYGAVAASIRWVSSGENGSAYCYSGSSGCNHAIAAIGWDDGFPADRFNTAPPGDGAWIIKNSWGRGVGEGGFYYVSYYDTRFGTDDDNTVFLPAEDGEAYDAVHGYDRLGVTYDIAAAYPGMCRFDLQAAVFTSAWNEELAAVGVYTSVWPAPYEISIYTNVTRNASTPVEDGVLASRVTGVLPHAGFSTIPLTTPVALADGSAFSVVYRQTGSIVSTWVNCEFVGYCSPSHRLGESYFGFAASDGGEDVWYDGADTNVVYAVDRTDVAWGACIKAFTRSMVHAPSGDLPGAAEDGTKMMADLAVDNGTLYAGAGETFGAVAGLVGANGRTLWTNWLVGMDPANPEIGEFALEIAVTNNVPSLVWKPDLGNARTYTIWGRESLDQTAPWRVIEDLSATSARFFKVSVGQ